MSYIRIWVEGKDWGGSSGICTCNLIERYGGGGGGGEAAVGRVDPGERWSWESCPHPAMPPSLGITVPAARWTWRGGGGTLTLTAAGRK